jgi:hypothetical protein
MASRAVDPQHTLVAVPAINRVSMPRLLSYASIALLVIACLGQTPEFPAFAPCERWRGRRQHLSARQHGGRAGYGGIDIPVPGQIAGWTRVDELSATGWRLLDATGMTYPGRFSRLCMNARAGSLRGTAQFHRERSRRGQLRICALIMAMSFGLPSTASRRPILHQHILDTDQPILLDQALDDTTVEVETRIADTALQSGLLLPIDTVLAPPQAEIACFCRRPIGMLAPCERQHMQIFRAFGAQRPHRQWAQLLRCIRPPQHGKLGAYAIGRHVASARERFDTIKTAQENIRQCDELVAAVSVREAGRPCGGGGVFCGSATQVFRPPRSARRV